MRRLRITLAYDGSRFHGWQNQPGLRTVQQALETALQEICGGPISVTGSGRTDAGVHALGQVAHFDTSSSIATAQLLRALNHFLRPDAVVTEVEEVPGEFHARYSVKRKQYRYLIDLSPEPLPFWSNYVLHHPHPLNRDTMKEAATYLIGEHDFRSFVTEAGETDCTRTVYQLKIDIVPPWTAWSGPTRDIQNSPLERPQSNFLAIEIVANGFLYNMVRTIVGTLLEVGRGRISPSAVKTILESRDRTRAGQTVAAQGLYLVGATYE